MPARALGDYLIERPLGEGASAKVFLAQDRRNGNWVALKVFSPLGPQGSDEHSESRLRFVQEAEVIKRLQHPDIVALHDVGETAGALWLAMELATGCPLQRYAHAQRLLPPPVVLDIGIRVARALAHAHAQGVVHRDVKSSNVIVDLVTRAVKLTDFGTAQLPDSRRTGTEIMLGTPVYMAPELLAGSPAAPASDLYALGVMLFELLTGRRPHESASMGDLLRRVAAEPAPDLRLLAKQPGQRPASASHVAEELAAVRGRWPGEVGAI